MPRLYLRRLLAVAPASGSAGNKALGDLTQQLDQGLNFSIANNLRTGNLILDTLICMLVPLLIRYLLLNDHMQLLRKLLDPLQGRIFRSAYVRTIEYTEGGSMRLRYNAVLDDAQALLENTDRNNLLQKAIKLYMSDKYGLDALEMETNLVPTKKIKTETKTDMYGNRSTFSGSYNQLVSFAVQVMPKKGQWILVDRERQIWFMQTINETQVGEANAATKETKVTQHIKGTGPEAGKTVNDWIHDAFEWYKEQRKNDQDHSRFFYVAVPSEGGDKNTGASKVSFKQYLLSDQKTFQSLFFPEKDALLKLIDQFIRKQGKFAIPGFPDKLGLLLDGPPGTGKTSLIKALAHHCDRHVVAVNLAKLKTNQELMDLLFDLVFPVQGGDLPVKLKFEDLIFVMEDVDAANRIVYARSGGKRPTKKKKPKQDTQAVAEDQAEAEPKAEPAAAAPAASAPAAAPGAATNGGDASAVEEGAKSTDRAPPPEMSTLLRLISGKDSAQGDAAAQEALAGGEEAEEEGEEDDVADYGKSPTTGARKAESMVGEMLCKMLAGGGNSEPEDISKKGFGPFRFDGGDDLNLAGLLNVLDGVVDSPGRVVVMTTNHPDKLDPALIRPGRINKRIHLGYVEAASVMEMAAHYMQTVLTDRQRQMLGDVVSQRSVTPAQVEQCCAESDTLQDLIGLLERLQ